MKHNFIDRSNEQACRIIFAGAIAIAVASIYLVYRRKKDRRKDFVSTNPFYEDGRPMERYIFSLTNDNQPIQAMVEQGGDCYAVHLDGKYAGSLWQNEENSLQWITQDEALKPFVSDIGKKLSKVYSRDCFSAILMGTYPEVVAADWKSSETLEVIVEEETDLEIFATFLKDEVTNLVSFDDHLDLIVKKAHDAYFVIITVN
ncbi:hypothetical protein [Pedobacter agri]|uniref:hypothetical protein n=1 Tax=Pedobacter agri TaxID=454586 RepID=UPI00292F3964|nr:hypothetical protein [Pedobacter agri]